MKHNHNVSLESSNGKLLNNQNKHSFYKKSVCFIVCLLLERVRMMKLELEEAEKMAAEAELTINMPAPANTPAEPVSRGRGGGGGGGSKMVKGKGESGTVKHLFFALPYFREATTLDRFARVIASHKILT